MGLGGTKQRVIMAFLAVSLMACDMRVPPATTTTPPPVTQPTLTVDTVPEPSQVSKDLATYYLRLQNDLLSQGLLRGDGGGPDTPYSDAQLARNFVRIALFNEYRDDSGHWFRAYGNENWEFDENGLMAHRHASINEKPIAEEERKFHWSLGRRPDDHPGLSELGL